ncbi:DUF1629 domain-containing protein [Stenotrophomonas sp. PS02289]|uniref:imm11 family protein n=1 Tax=Stenotrophomonas sp. PS02289 TaxID=2991422 RepID=UPI00249C82A8|nr:DUF1629 domain-containing protein [Stenotrophomonas sp. PS02289]
MKYFRIHPDLAMRQRWILGDIRYADNWSFLDPPVERMEPCCYALDLHFDGVAVDFTVAGSASVPIVSARFCDALAGLPEIEEPYTNTVMEPVSIEGASGVAEYFVMIVESKFDCIHGVSSNFIRFAFNDAWRPSLSDENSAAFNLVLDASKIGDKHIFRLMGYPHALIVSEEVKTRLERDGVTGVAFERMLIKGDR